MQKTSFLILLVYTLFSTALACQNLHLEINGNSEYETKVIDSLNYTKQHSDFSSINLEVDYIQKLLYKNGYIENELKGISKIDDSSFTGKFNLKKKYYSLYIYYDKSVINNSVLKLISKYVYDDYFELEFNQVQDALNFINIKVNANGDPFSKLTLSNIQVTEAQKLTAHLKLETTDIKRTINTIEIKGYEKFPRAYLEHFLKIKTGQIFNLNSIKKKTERLNDLKFANQVKSPEVLFSKDSTSLYIYLEKAKSNSFDGFLGFGTNDDTNNLEFDGYLNLNLTNNLNYGETFKLLYISDENKQKTFKTDVALPYLFKSPVGVDLQLQIFKRDSSFTTVNQFAKLHYQLNPKHKIYTGIINSESNNLLNKNTNLSIIDYKTSYYSIAYEYIKPQNSNFLFPYNTKLFFETNFGERKASNNSQKQSQFAIDAFKIYNLNLKNSFYLRINGATLISKTYVENELFRFGGINSLRGFEENSIFSSLFSLINTEYRLKLSNTIYVHSIIDAAYFENKIHNTKEKGFGYGFGLGILTKSGLFRFNYANGKLENYKFKLSNSKIHISLTTDF